MYIYKFIFFSELSSSNSSRPTLQAGASSRFCQSIHPAAYLKALLGVRTSHSLAWIKSHRIGEILWVTLYVAQMTMTRISLAIQPALDLTVLILLLNWAMPFKGDKITATSSIAKVISDSDSEQPDLNSALSKMIVPEPLLSEMSDSEDHVTPRPNLPSSAPKASTNRRMKQPQTSTKVNLNRLSESESSSSEDERPVPEVRTRQPVVAAPPAPPTPGAPTEAIPKRRGPGRPPKKQVNSSAPPSGKEVSKRPGRPKKQASSLQAPISREILDTTTSSVSCSSSPSNSEVDVENTPSPLKARKPSLSVTVTPPTTPRKTNAHSQSPSKLATRHSVQRQLRIFRFAKLADGK